MLANNGTRPAHLILADGTTYAGVGLGADKDAIGEVVFNTSMTGYQEMLTDPSYRGQLLVFTYPLIGNYGINKHDFEADTVQPNGVIVRQACDLPSHNASEYSLDAYLKKEQISGIAELDTRAITTKIRAKGAMMGMITTREDVASALADLRAAPNYNQQAMVSAARQQEYSPHTATKPAQIFKVALVDYGVKNNIVRLLNKRGCDVYTIPYDADFGARIGELNVDGVVYSPGPGDPEFESLDGKIIRELLDKGVPVFGICLGHQLLAREFGATTYKLKFGHRGGNQPVKELETGDVAVTAHNHGYAVHAESIPAELAITHINLNDNTVEGIRHKELPLITIQYHAEAAPGPTDAEYIFDRFLELVKAYKATQVNQ